MLNYFLSLNLEFFRQLSTSLLTETYSDDNEQNTKQTIEDKNLTKSARKNKKRREALKKNKEHDNSSNNVCNVSPKDIDVFSNPVHLHPNENTGPMSISNNETNKKLRKLHETLLSIQTLKSQQQEGKILEKNQIEKINREENILLEIRKLET